MLTILIVFSGIGLITFGFLALMKGLIWAFKKDSESKKGFIAYSKALVICIAIITVSNFFENKKSKTSASQASDNSVFQKKSEQAFVIPEKPAETKEQFIASTKLIGLKDSPVYWKEFLKNPDKFSGQRLKIRAKILEIEESQGQTVIQAYISNDYDMIIILHPDSIPFYKDDQIWVYGIGGGSFEAQNRMGATMSWPIIYSKYVEEFKNM